MPPLGFSQKQAFLNNRFKQSRKIQLIGRSFLRKQADGRHAGQGVGFKAINTVFVNHKVGPCICAETENTEDFAGCFRHALGGVRIYIRRADLNGAARLIFVFIIVKTMLRDYFDCGKNSAADDTDGELAPFDLFFNDTGVFKAESRIQRGEKFIVRADD